MLASKEKLKIVNGGGENILGDGLEALIGSIYLDSGLINQKICEAFCDGSY